MREEMEFHREARISDLVARGLDPEEAARTARLEFGNAEAWREECRQQLGYRPWDELYADLRFAVRGLKNNPGFAAATVTILSLAIGVNGAFFSLYSNYGLKPLPIRGVERHFSVSGFDWNGRSTSGWSTPEVEALRRSVGREMEGLYTLDKFQVLALALHFGHFFLTEPLKEPVQLSFQFELQLVFVEKIDSHELYGCRA